MNAFKNADLRGADFKNARGMRHYEDFKDSDLRGANFSGAILLYVQMQRVDAREADFRASGLPGGIFDGADLRGACFMCANLQDSSFRGADLRGADLRDAFLRGANFTGAKLEGVDLRDAYLTQAIFDDENFIKSQELSETIEISGKEFHQICDFVCGRLDFIGTDLYDSESDYEESKEMTQLLSDIARRNNTYDRLFKKYLD